QPETSPGQARGILLDAPGLSRGASRWPSRPPTGNLAGASPADSKDAPDLSGGGSRRLVMGGLTPHARPTDTSDYFVGSGTPTCTALRISFVLSSCTKATTLRCL